MAVCRLALAGAVWRRGESTSRRWLASAYDDPYAARISQSEKEQKDPETPFDTDYAPSLSQKRLRRDRSLLANLCKGTLDERALHATVPVMVARLNQLSFHDCTRILAAYREANFSLPHCPLRLLLLRLLACEEKTHEFETVDDPRLIEPIICAARQLDQNGSGWLTRLLLRMQDCESNDDSSSSSSALREQLLNLVPPSDLRRTPRPSELIGRWTYSLSESSQSESQAFAVVRKDGKALFANPTTQQTVLAAWRLEPSRSRSIVFEIPSESGENTLLCFSPTEWQRSFSKQQQQQTMRKESSS